MSSQPTILIVDDEPPIRRFLRTSLVAQDYRVVEADTGTAALARIADEHPDLIVLDLGLPDIDGMEFLRRLRGGSRPETPVVILTARDSLEDRINGLNAGADDYVIKPFDLAELDARLRAVLRRPGPRRGRVYAYGAVTFDTVSREACVNETPLDLTRRETALIEELLRSPGRVIPKDSLEEDRKSVV